MILSPKKFLSLRLFFAVIICSLLLGIIPDREVNAYSVTCISSTTDVAGYATLFSLSSTTNATVADSGVYSLKVQCTSPNAILSRAYNATTTGCGGGNILPLFTYTNVSSPPYNTHIANPNNVNYPSVLCLTSSLPFDYATTTTKTGDCTGYGTTLMSVSSSNFNTTGNVHVGDANAYPLKVCLTVLPQQSISVSISSSSLSFGTLSPSLTKYATSDGLGTTTAFSATSSSFYIDVSTTGNSNYNVSLQGDTLRNQQANSIAIPAIGAVPTALTPGTEQFGISALAICQLSNSSMCLYPVYSSSTILYPYNTPDYAYAGDVSTPTLIGSGPGNDGAGIFGGSRFLIRLAANIANNTPAGDYSTGLTVVVTAEF